MIFIPIILIFNLLDQIIKSQSFIERAVFTLPLFIFIILCWIFRKKYKFNAYLFYVVSILAVLTTNEAANLTGLVFLIFALFIFQNNRMIYIMLISTPIAIALKTFYDFSHIQIITLVFGYIYCLLIYFILIHPKKPNIYTGLDEITREIIEYKMAGWSTKAVADKVCLSTDAVQKRISRACDKYDAGNLAQLVYKLMKKGFISQ